MHVKKIIAAAAVIMFLAPVAAMATVSCVCGDATPGDGMGECAVTSSSGAGLTVISAQTLTSASFFSNDCVVGSTSCSVVVQGSLPISEYSGDFTDADNTDTCMLGPGNPLPVELVEFTVE